MTSPLRRSLAEAYAAAEPEALGWLGGDFRDRERWTAAIRNAGPLHDSARQLLHAQNTGRADTEARRASLSAIDCPGTVMVVTGQQPGLFGGALLTYLKAASAVTLARRVEREHGVRCVPVFWVQSEDHDFSEVAEHVWLDASGHLGSTVLEGADARISLEHRTLSDDIDRHVEALGAGLDGTPHGPEIARAIHRAYSRGGGIAEAFASLLADLFADDGLLVFRPRHPSIARALAPLYQRCVREMVEIDNVLSERADALDRAGYHVQVPIRSGTALGFFHPDGPTGPRYRIVRHDEAGTTLGLAGDDRRYRREDLLQAAEREPLCFSASALLRPILQDRLLPTVAYVGGPSELAYFAELRPLYGRFDRAPPLTVPRIQARWIHDEAAGLLEGRTPDEDLLADDGPIGRELASQASGLDLTALEQRLDRAVCAELEAVEPQLTALDPGLAKACAKTRASTQQMCDKLIRRATRAALSHSAAHRARLERLRDLLRPRGKPQERVLGWTSPAARLGPGRLRAQVLAFDPFEPGVHTIRDEV